MVTTPKRLKDTISTDRRANCELFDDLRRLILKTRNQGQILIGAIGKKRKDKIRRKAANDYSFPSDSVNSLLPEH